ncbi:MAG TPA: D-glycero-beta-D-manno-heptose 1-phosphate adenylyltransferase [Pyrinomonadaceae bacterium]|nr:D-glycero-beta-D-manno-heptose 1-phosphate adenylyltransferase [Pyrinomonadaceae bacterium]
METVVFTNGCFDLLHPGHIDLLTRAKGLGTRLVVGINSDASVRKIKGPDRPFTSEKERTDILSAISVVDEVIVFDEQTPERLIKELKPDVLVKGGDWKPEEIIGSEFVIGRGGKVVSLPFLDGYSSSRLVEKIRQTNGKGASSTAETTGIAQRSLSQHLETFNSLIRDCGTQIDECANIIVDTVKRGKKILICGNGGSAADAQHIAAEFVGRYETERRALPAIALTTDTSALTALANDYDFERIFSRQVDALAAEGDCLIGISTSGNSPNVIAAVMAARRKGCRIIGMTGAKGKKLAALCDAALMVPAERTARIQEAHITVAHIWCEIVDETISQE